MYTNFKGSDMGKSPVVRNEAQEIQALQDTLYVIGGKWRLPIMNSLCNGNTRFREIERSIPGITTRMLSKELRGLELNGIISRTVQGSSPVLVEYKTTEYCKTFSTILLEMIKWGIAHKKHITRKK
jgi:DNA-binding HxlR family transcriptional regulator